MTKSERTASRNRTEAARAEARAARAANACPTCGATVHDNLSITGWVQCDRSGAPGFRRDVTGNSCNWRGFTA